MGTIVSLRRASAAVLLSSLAGCGGGSLGGPAGAGGGTVILTGMGGAAGGSAGATAGGAGAGTGGGAGGATGVAPDPCTGPSDPRLVIAKQRTVLLTSREVNNMIRAIFGDAEAYQAANFYPVTADAELHFLPSDGGWREINDLTIIPFQKLANHIGQYVADNFARETGCAIATDDCALAYLGAFAEKAYRRPLDAGEQSDLQGRYQSARTGATVEQSTQQVLAAILVAPAFMFRSEMGEPTRASTSPPGVPLTPYELASALSFFLTDAPPDQPLLDAARGGTLTPDNVGPQVDRLIATPAARAWLTELMEIYFGLNQLPNSYVDRSRFPEVTPGLLADMQTEAQMFLDSTLWDGTFTDLLTSRTTFLNATLATMVYRVPVPAGATAIDFVPTTLPADQRSGILTNAGYLATKARPDGESLVYRARLMSAGMIGWINSPPIDTATQESEGAQFPLLASQTAQEEVQYRSSMPTCVPCHLHIDPYGLALSSYDVIGRFLTVDERGAALNTRAVLPPELGSAHVGGAVDLANVIAASPAFMNHVATELLQYAMSDYSALVEAPNLPGQPPTAACAVNDLVQRFRARPTQTFAGLLHDIATSPAFAYRQPVQ